MHIFYSNGNKIDKNAVIVKVQFQNAFHLKSRTTKQLKHDIHSIKLFFLLHVLKITFQFTIYAFQNVFQYYPFKLYNLFILLFATPAFELIIIQ